MIQTTPQLVCLLSIEMTKIGLGITTFILFQFLTSILQSKMKQQDLLGDLPSSMNLNLTCSRQDNPAPKPLDKHSLLKRFIILYLSHFGKIDPSSKLEKNVVFFYIFNLYNFQKRNFEYRNVT